MLTHLFKVFQHFRDNLQRRLDIRRDLYGAIYVQRNRVKFLLFFVVRATKRVWKREREKWEKERKVWGLHTHI